MADPVELRDELEPALQAAAAASRAYLERLAADPVSLPDFEAALEPVDTPLPEEGTGAVDAVEALGDVLQAQARAADAVHGQVIPANLRLAEAELALAGKIGREVTLRSALREIGRAHV